MRTAVISVTVLAVVLAAILWHFRGAGSFRRIVTRSGIYSVCKPDGYPVVCFLDADGHDGGLACLPLSSAGGVCR